MRVTFIVNPASGGRRGQALAAMLRDRGEVVHDIRLVELASVVATAEGPLVACGGDGTMAAVLDAVHGSGREVPVAVVPLGTGNDLARHLGWPTTPPDGEELGRWLAHAIAAPARRLDRWMLEGPGLRRAWFNYWSMGDDAAAAHRFHHLRRVQSWLMRGGGFNKALYGLCGLQEPGNRLNGAMTPLPSVGAGSLVVANIPSYAGGLRLGPRIRSDDGRLDVFALPVGLGLGFVLARLKRARSLGQHREFQIDCLRPLPMQLDGEPFTAGPGCWRVWREGQVRVLAGPGVLQSNVV